MHLSSVTIRHERYPGDDVYPFNLDILKRSDRLEFPGPVVFFIGENGSGKSTLLEGIARSGGIHIWQEPDRSRTGNNPLEQDLYRCLDVEWTAGPVPGAFFAADTFKHFALLLDEWASLDPGLMRYFGGHSLVDMSHGECNMAFFRSRFSRTGIYLLDEPETALSPSRQIELLRLLMALAPGGTSQFIIATHSPILLAYPGARIYDFNRAPIGPIAYRDTDYFRVYREFLEDPERFLR